MKKVIISPYSRKLRNKEGSNPKDYPFWGDVILGLKEKGIYVCQIGVNGEKKLDNVDEFIINKPLKELKQMLMDYDTWVSVDNFCQHLAWLYGKPGVVIFGKSDPSIFGHPENENLLKDRIYLRKGIAQFQMWEQTEYNKECFIEPGVVIDAILRRISNE